MKKISILWILTFILSGHGLAQSRKLFLHAYLHVGNGEVLPSAAVGVEGDEIILVKNSLAYSYDREDWDTIIELRGKHMYPGFVAPNSTLGLTEIDAVRATRDFDEVGTFNPHVRAQIAYNAESDVISTVRSNGVLLIQATPRGGFISGTSAIMEVYGWNWEDATVVANDGIHVNWPADMQGGGWWAEPKDKKVNEKYAAQKQELERFFRAARAYAATDTGKKEEDPRYEAMRRCFKGEKRVFFHADNVRQLLDIIEFSKELELSFPVIVGGYESYLVARRLKDAGIPVMLNRTHSLPENEDDPVDLPYKLPYLLQQEGVKFCLQNAGDMEAMNARNLPFQAGTAMAYGLSEEQAVRSISLSACEILGIEKNYGTVEQGKKAMFFVSEGNALDMRSNEVLFCVSEGQIRSVKNRQWELYIRYTKKYRDQQPR